MGPDPYTFRSIWGVPVTSRDAFDLLVARQLMWMPNAAPDVRAMLFTASGEPICPVCAEVVGTGAASIICMGVLADPGLQAEIAADPRIMATRDPDSLEAWWLVHGECADTLTRGRVQELNQRIELALRAATRAN